MTEARGGGRRPIRVLFLCTGNSARSQIAEALLARKGRDRFEVGSAGSRPADRVNPLAVRALREYGIDWSGKAPKGSEAVSDRQWDLIITVCDRAREACPTFAGRPVFAHWSVPDPADVVGTEEDRLHAFRDTVTYLGRRIDLMLCLPIERLEERALEPELEALTRFEPDTSERAK
ncbi:MAG: arsenate reductase ArsC [Gemmatimonadaceae bacterium]